MHEAGFFGAPAKACSDSLFSHHFFAKTARPLFAMMPSGNDIGTEKP
jgi:hypothetical protein